MTRSTGKPPDRLYSDALADQVTEVMDRVCADLGDPKDEFVASAARRILERTEWVQKSKT